MGNCSLKGIAAAENSKCIRVMTDSGGILDFEGPKFVREVLSDFPGYGVFSKSRLSSPLLDHEILHGGQFYYLLPRGENGKLANHKEKSVCEAEPVRMSTSATMEAVHNLKNGSGVEVLPPPQKGVWRVKLVIDIKQLEEILAEEVNVEALIEQMRLAASSASVASPKRTTKMIIWGQWGVNWKPNFTTLFKGKAANELQNVVL